MILKPIENNGVTVGYVFHCPACNDWHTVLVKPHRAPNNASWNFDGDEIHPTFRPSILTKYKTKKGLKVCHLFITNGRINYCEDSTHGYRNREITMWDIAE